MKKNTSKKILRVAKRYIRRYYVPFSLILFMAFAIFISREYLAYLSLRLDEAQNIWQSSHTPTSLIYIVAQDVHVPLFHTLLYFWEIFFGKDVYITRILPLIFFVITIPSVYLLARTVLNKNGSLFAAFIITLSPFMNWYGNETRMYTLLILLTVLNQYFFIKIMKTNSRLSWFGFLIVSLFGIFSHYFFLLVLLTEAIYFLLKKKEFYKGSFIRFFLIALTLILAFAPWIIYVFKLGFASGTQPALIRPSSVDFFNTYSQFIFGFQSDYINTLILSLWPLLILFGFLAIRKNKNIPSAVQFFFLAAVLPIIFAFLFSTFIKPFFLSRYLIVSLPSLYIAITWLFSLYPKKLSIIFKILLTILMIATLGIEIFSTNISVKENYKDVSIYLSQHVSPEDIVAISTPFTIYPIEYYYTGSAALTTLPIWDRYVNGPIPPLSSEELLTDNKIITTAHENIWLVLSYDQGYQKELQMFYETHYQRLQYKVFGDNIKLYEYKLRYDTSVKK